MELQGFRYEAVTARSIFTGYDPVQPLTEQVYTSLELLMSDCVLCTEPSTDAILVSEYIYLLFVIQILGYVQLAHQKCDKTSLANFFYFAMKINRRHHL